MKRKEQIRKYKLRKGYAGYLPRGCFGQLSHEEAVRNPLKYKGLRTKFRTRLNAGSAFKYKTDLSRQKELIIELKKGDIEEFIKLINEKFPSQIFEGFLIKIWPRRQ